MCSCMNVCTLLGIFPETLLDTIVSVELFNRVHFEYEFSSFQYGRQNWHLMCIIYSTTLLYFVNEILWLWTDLWHVCVMSCRKPYCHSCCLICEWKPWFNIPTFNNALQYRSIQKLSAIYQWFRRTVWFMSV